MGVASGARPSRTLVTGSARITGNEFLLLLESTQVDAGVAMADTLYALLNRHLSIDGHDVLLEICMGIAVYPTIGQSVEELISRAAIARRDAAALPGYLQVYQQDRDLAHQRQIQLIRDLLASRVGSDRSVSLIRMRPCSAISRR